MIILKIIAAIIVGVIFGCFCFVAAPLMFLYGAINGRWPWEM